MNTEICILWLVRVAIFLIILGLFLPNKNKKTILTKVIHSRNNIITSTYSQNKIVKYFDKITENNFIRTFMLKEDSDDYAKLEQLIIQAGGLGGLTPNIVQMFRIILPPIAFVVSLVMYLLKITVSTSNLTASEVQKIINQSNSVNGFLQAKAVSGTVQQPGINWIVIMWIFILSLFIYTLPTFLIKQKIKSRRIVMAKELPIIETFIVIMLESGTHTIYDILKTLLDTTNFFKPYVTMCLNEYYVDPKKAIQNMADRVNDEEFQIVCNSLKQAVDMDKRYTVTFMKQHLDQIKKIQELKREASIKKKPLLYVFLLAMPLLSIVVIWFYPWFTRAIKMLTVGF